jgi:hypothetical protein
MYFLIQINNIKLKIPFWSTIVKNFRVLNKDDIDGIIENSELGAKFVKVLVYK